MTAEKLLGNNIDGLREIINDDDLFLFYKGVVCEFAKEFAEYHVDKALVAASKTKLEANYDNTGVDEERYPNDKSLILNAYSIDNIK
jgi:hypothetical protein